MKFYFENETEFETELNKVKDIMMGYLYNLGIINLDIADEIINNVAFIIKKPNFFSKIFDKLTKKNAYTYIIVKQLNLTTDDEENKNNLILFKNNEEIDNGK